MPAIEARRWEGSLATSMDPESLTPGDFTVLRNFIFDRSGLPTVRGGRRKWNTSALQDPDTGVLDDFNGLYHYRSGWISERPEDWLIAYAGQRLFKSELDGVWDPIMTGLEKGLRPSFATLRGWLLFAPGGEKTPDLYYWEPSLGVTAKIKDAPKPSLVAAHAGRLWVVDRDYPSRIWYSAPFEPANWKIDNGAGYLTINPGDGAGISALVPGFMGEMIVFKDGPSGGASYRIQGLAEPFSVMALSSTLGAVSQQAVTLIRDQDIFFASRRGIHSIRRVFEFGDLEAKFLDVEIVDRWRSLSDRARAIATSVDDFTHDTWWLFVDTNNDGVNDTAWCFNYRWQSPRQNPKISEVSFGAGAAVVFTDPKSGTSLLMTGDNVGFARTEHHPEANDDGVSYAWTATLAPILGDDPLAMKSWLSLWLRHENWGYGEMTLTWYGDNRPPSSTTLTMNPGAAPVPFFETRLNEFRGFPPLYRAANLVHVREGGRALNLSLTGTRGRTRLRGFRLEHSVDRYDVNADQWITYTDRQTRMS